MEKRNKIGNVAQTLYDITNMNQMYVMNLLIDVEGRIKRKEICGGDVNLSKSNFDTAGNYILDTYLKMNPKETPNFIFDENAMKDVYFRVDSKGTKNEK